MDVQLDDQSRQVLYNAFKCCDFDGDDYISQYDLRLACGFDNDEELEAVFQALKDSGGNQEPQDLVTFEDFVKGVVDFPFILEQFNQEDNQSHSSSDQNQHLFTIESKQSYEEDELLGQVLKDSFANINKGLAALNDNSSAPEPDFFQYINQLDSFDSALTCLEFLQEKVKSSPQSKTNVYKSLLHITESVTGFIRFIQDQREFHADQIKEFEGKLSEANYQYLNSAKRIEWLEQLNGSLSEKLQELESENQMTMEAHNRMIAEKERLQEQIRNIENQEESATIRIYEIQQQIGSKESEIHMLQKEVRRLESYKTIEKMKNNAQKHITPQAFQESRRGGKQHRGSVPSTFRLSTTDSPRMSVKKPMEKTFREQLVLATKQNNELRELLDEQEKRNKNLIAHLYQENALLKQKNKELLEDMDSQDNMMPSQSLLEEMAIIKEETTLEDIDFYSERKSTTTIQSNSKRMINVGIQVDIVLPVPKQIEPQKTFTGTVQSSGNTEVKEEKKGRENCCICF